LTTLGNTGMLTLEPNLGHLGTSDQPMTVRITGPKRQMPWRDAASEEKREPVSDIDAVGWKV
jgi:hypothetical protein